MDINEFNDLEIGDRIRHEIYGISYIISKIKETKDNKRIITATKTINIKSPYFYKVTIKRNKNSE